jgi:hypothetical protein
MLSEAALADVISSYVTTASSTGATYDCRQLAEYQRFVGDIIDHVKHTRRAVVSADDVDRVIAETPLLRNHPMLARHSYLASSTTTSTAFDDDDRPSRPSGSFLDNIFNAFRAPSREEKSKRARFIEAESTRVRGLVRAALAAAAARQYADMAVSSSELDGDYCLPIMVSCASAAADTLLAELQLEYAEAQANERRPYLEKWMSLNQRFALHIEPKHVICYVLGFRFPVAPQ